MSEEQSSALDAERLCGLTGLTDRRHRQIAKDGYFPPPVGGKYKLTETLRGLFRYYRELSQKRNSSTEDEKRKKLTAERKIEELKLARMMGNSLDAESVVRAWQGVVMVARQKLLGMENKVSGRLGFDDHQRQELRKEIEEALAELSKRQIYERIGQNETDEGHDEGGDPIQTPAENERS